MGSLNAYLLFRDKVDSNFLSSIWDVFGKLKTLFTLEGKLRKDKRGVFGAEIDHGTILLIEDLKLYQKYKIEDYAFIIMERLFESFKGHFKFALMELPFDTKNMSNIALLLRLRREFRKLGFQTMKPTPFIGCVPDPSHRCHSWIADDTDLTEITCFTEQELELGDLIQSKLSSKVIIRKISQLVQKGVCLNKSGALQRASLNCRSDLIPDLIKLGCDVNALDRIGSTALSVASASQSKLEIIQLLMSFGADPKIEDRLMKRVPAGILEEHIVSVRESAKLVMSLCDTREDLLKMCPEFIECMKLLAPEKYLGKYGCTCGKCIEDCLSPRMSFLLEQSIPLLIRYDTKSDDENPILKGASLHLLPSPLSTQRDKDFIMSVANILHYAYQLVKQGKAPTLGNLSLQKENIHAVFWNGDGTLEKMIDMLIKQAKIYEHSFAESPDWEDIPECLNDDFFFLNRMLKLKNRAEENLSEVATNPPQITQKEKTTKQEKETPEKQKKTQHGKKNQTTTTRKTRSKEEKQIESKQEKVQTIVQQEQHQPKNSPKQEKETKQKKTGKQEKNDKKQQNGKLKNKKKRQIDEEGEDDEEEYEVETIVSKKKIKGKDHYLIKWKGYKERTWEPLQNLDGCVELIKEFENKKSKH